MAASAAESLEPKETECVICSEPYTDPKLLPCGHLLCSDCLLTWMRTQDEARCPVCRDLIVGPQDRRGQSLKDLVTRLPTDLSMARMVRHLQADRILSRQHHCCVCEDVAVTSVCLNCKDMLCQTCKKGHGKLSATKHHVVEDLSTLTADKMVASGTLPCSSHPDEVPRLFCPTHAASICLLCASSKHRGCPEVKDLGEKMEESHALLKRLLSTLIEGEAEFDEALNGLDEHLATVQRKAEVALAEIEDLCAELDALVQASRRRLKEQVGEARAGAQHAVRRARTQLLRCKGRLITHRHAVQRVRAARSREVVTTMAPRMEERVGHLCYDLTLPHHAQGIPDLRFVTSSKALTRIRQDLGNLGEVQMQAASVTANEKVRMVVFCDS
ncbi:hypothetical protein ACOMHN_054462 [Nucella lapillus]